MNKTVAKRRQAGFSLLDLMVVIVCIAAVLSVQIPADAASRRTARRMQNSTQLRGIHQGLVTFANSNKDRFPGLSSRGEILPDNDVNTGSSGPGDYVQARYWLMLDGDYFTPEYAISPSETHALTEYEPGLANVAAPVQWNARQKHYSYAMLGIAGNPGQAPAAPGRGAEWAMTLNSQAVVLSDRNTGMDAGRRVQSIHTDEAGVWAGSVLWNDNHVGFENAGPLFATKYAEGALHADQFGDNGSDNLFAAENDAGGKAGYDALMTIADNNIVHGAEE